ncbi:unnamed protein product, partial [Candidula unifasciata]
MLVMQEMSTSKRTYDDIDPDYTDVCEQQTKRQRAIEQDAKHGVCKRIQAVVRNEFQKEINNKEMELHQADKRLNEARLMMDRLRACIVSTYYRQIYQFGMPEASSTNGPSSSIHPAVKKCLGKRPVHHQINSDTATSHPQKSSGVDISSSVVGKTINFLCTFSQVPSVPSLDASYDDRRARFKIKKKVIIGNVSKYIPIDHRETNDKSSHKWMVYVRGPKSEPDISGFVRKVWFFLHHSYKPNDLVEISSPPFHLTRRGWGEFPVRVQLHFVDPRNKKVDIIHQLKLDKTFSGLQTLGAETTVEVDLERDFFETDANGRSHHLRQSSSSSLSSYHERETLLSSLYKAAPVPTERVLPVSHTENIVLSEQSGRNLHDHSQSGGRSWSCESVMDNKCAPSECLKADMSGTEEGCVADLAMGLEPVFEMETETVTAEKEYNVTIAHETNESEHHGQEEEEEIIVTDVSRTGKDTQKNGTDSSTANIAAVYEPQNRTSGTQFQQEFSSAKPSLVTPLTIISKSQLVKSADVSGIMSVTLQRSTSNISNSLLQQPSPNISNSLLQQPSPNISNSVTQLHTSNISHSLLQLPTSKISHSLPQLPISNISNTLPQLLRSNISTSANKISHAQAGDSESKNPLFSSVDHNTTVTPVPSHPSSFIVLESSGVSVKPIIKQLCPSLPSLPSSVSVLPVLNTAKIIAPPVFGSTHLPSSQHISSTATASRITKSSVGPSAVSLSQLMLPKPPQPSPQFDSQKLFIVKSNIPDVKLQVSGPSSTAAGSKSLLQPKPSGPKQVSLLTGRVFTPPTPPPVAAKAFASSQKTQETLLAKHSLVTKDMCNQILSSQSQITKSGSKQGQVLILKTVNHSGVSIPQATDQGANQAHSLANIKLVNGILGQDVTSHSVNVSYSTPGGFTSELPLTVMNNYIPINSSTSQTMQQRPTRIMGSDIVLHVPGQYQTQLNGHGVSSFTKMSAIGMTKRGKNPSALPVVNTNFRPTTDEERRQNQYEVLMEWKRNRHLEEKAKAVARVVRDKIEEKQILDDYSSMRALVKAAVRLHPLVQASVNKLTHPYCAESLEQWNSWTVGKQLGSEWHRACFVLKYLNTLLGTSNSFQGETLMSTRQLVQWCRQHAFSPLITGN